MALVTAHKRTAGSGPFVMADAWHPVRRKSESIVSKAQGAGHAGLSARRNCAPRARPLVPE
jgi:hypothetical protein